MKPELAWINTEQPPLKIKRLGVFTYEKGDELHVSELCEAFYPHPDAPELATVSIQRWYPVEFLPGTDRAITYILDAMRGISEITKLASS